MRHSVTAVYGFEAGHQVSGDMLCGRQHGHQWEVAVTVDGGLDPKAVHVVDHAELLTALAFVFLEFDLHDLNDMAPGLVTTPEGLTIYIHERLVMSFPNISEVRVKMGERISATTRWDVR